jgi:surface antigen
MGGTQTSGRSLRANFGETTGISLHWAGWKRSAVPALLLLLAACGTVNRAGQIAAPSTPQSSSVTSTSVSAPVIPANDEDAGGRSVFDAADTVPQLSVVDLPSVEAGKGAEGHVIGDDYPFKSKAPDSAFDPWREYVRECTSFVAWRLHSVNGFEMPFFDNATGWGPKARARHFQVDGNPGLGSVAWWATGHVAWVAAIDGNTVTIEEYNHVPFAYSTRTIQVGYKGVQFIHFADLPNVPAAPATTQQATSQPTPATTAL